MDLLHRQAHRAPPRRGAAPGRSAPPPSASIANALLAVRYVLPATLLIVGIALWAAGGTETIAIAGAALVGAALTILVVNLYVRLAFSSQEDRDREAAARRQRAEVLARRRPN